MIVVFFISTVCYEIFKGGFGLLCLVNCLLHEFMLTWFLH